MQAFTIIDNSLNQGLIYGFLALSVFLSLRLLDFPDLTIEGSFPLGAAIAAAFAKYYDIGFGSLPVVLLGGFAAGTATALLHTRLRLGKLLSGIVVSVGLYSICFRVMGARANLYLVGGENPFAGLRVANRSFLQAIFGDAAVGITAYPVFNLVVLAIVAVVVCLLVVLLRTEKGCLIRFAREDARIFLESIGINHKVYVVLGLGIANAIAAFAGALVVYQEGSASITQGFGIILTALVSLVIGEQIIRLFHRDLTDLWPIILCPFAGAIVYALIVRLVRYFNTLWQIQFGFPDPTSQFQYFNSDVKILSVAIMVLLYALRRDTMREMNIPERL